MRYASTAVLVTCFRADLAAESSSGPPENASTWYSEVPSCFVDARNVDSAGDSGSVDILPFALLTLRRTHPSGRISMSESSLGWAAASPSRTAEGLGRSESPLAALALTGRRSPCALSSPTFRMSREIVLLSDGTGCALTCRDPAPAVADRLCDPPRTRRPYESDLGAGE